MVNAEKRRRTATPTRTSSAVGTGRVATGGPAPGAGPEGGERRKPSLWAKARYRFDLALARGPVVVIGYLGLVMLAIIVAAALVLMLTRIGGVNGDGHGITNPFEAFWQALLRVLDSGTFAADSSWPARFLGLFITLAGIFLAGSLIGLIANAVDQQIERLRKGRSNVLETGHTLVLGWSPRMPTILAELVEANANQKHAAVVVLADVPKDEMDDELRRQVPHTRSTRVVCRTGDPSRPADLEMVNVAEARSVIVLAGEEGDAGVVKAVLAVRSLDPVFERAHVVAELESAGHARTLRTLTDGRIVTVQADEVIARVTAQACHQAGLSSVFRELLDFDGDEVYFTPMPDLAGVAYRDVLLAFESCSVLGWLTDTGEVVLNPPADALFGAGYEVITVAGDDDLVICTGVVDRPDVTVDCTRPFEEPSQRVLMIGWSDLGPGVLDELDEFLTAGSTVDLLVDPALVDTTGGGVQPPVPPTVNTEVRVHLHGGGPEELLALGEVPYDQAIVLGYRSRLAAGEADARTMLTLLTLDMAFPGEGGPRVVAEMLDRNNVAVAQTTGVEDFIVSDELSSLMIAQLSERLELHLVFDELFDADGCFVALHPAPLYAPDTEVTFAAVVAAASMRGETAFGYRVAATGEVVVNPPKSATVALGPVDQVLILGPRATRPVTEAALDTEPDLTVEEIVAAGSEAILGDDAAVTD